MRILFLQFPLVPAWGGAEVQTLLLAQGLQQAGHKIRVVSSNSALITRLLEQKFNATKLWAGFEPTSATSLFLFPLAFIIGLLLFTISLITIRPKVVICLSLTDKLIATPLAKLVGVRVIWVEHTRLGRWFYKNPLLPWYRLMSRAVKIVAPSYFLRNQLIKGGIDPNRVTVIYPATPSLPLHKGEMKRGSGERSNTFMLGFLGRLTEEKGVDVLLHALKELPHINAQIAGTGPTRESLKKLTIALGITNQVEFVGFVKDKQEFFESIDTLILPSIKAESFGVVIIEAMAAGVPVIASRIGAIPEIIEHKKTGLLFEPGNYLELVKLVNLLQLNSSIKQGFINAAAKSVMIRFNTDKLFSEYERLLKL